MAKLRWLKSARGDLKDIHDFIAIESKKYAIYQVKKIRERAKRLEAHPYLGKIVPEYGNDEIRELDFGHYRIIYRVMSLDLIHIILIHHGARRFPRIDNLKIEDLDR